MHTTSIAAARRPRARELCERSTRRTATLAIATAAAVSVVSVGLASPANAAPAFSYTTTTVPIDNHLRAVALDQAKHSAYLVGREDDMSNNGTVSVMDTVTRSVTHTIAVGGLATAVAVDSPGNRAYVALELSGNGAEPGRVQVIDTLANTIVGTVPVGVSPRGVALDDAGRQLYVTSVSGVSVIDTASNTVKATIPVGIGSFGVAIDQSRHTAYVTHYGFVNEAGSTVSVIDTLTNKVTGAITVGKDPTGIAIDQSTHTAYVANNERGLIDRHAGNGSVSVIDLTTNKVTATVPVGSGPFGIAVDEPNHTVYVANTSLAFSGTAVSIIDTTSNAVTDTVIADQGVVGVAVDSVNHTAYVANAGAVTSNGTSTAGSFSVIQQIDGTQPPTCPAVIGAIGAKYASLGGCDSVLGKATSAEQPAAGGAYTHFEHGDIYWSPATGAHVIKGAIEAAWANVGAEHSPLGYPTTDELTTPDTIGRYNHFQNGSIYYTPTTGAHEIYGAIGQTWANQGYERSGFGYPTTGEFDFLFGRINLFEHGFIYNNPVLGTIPFHW